ncbi:BLUF domain-containing protein [Magnetovibrio sp. PR-2]|uniref:BLUF domain-containing protein n=1 Tax=Magnetovibrio sp. PR-2 TaxID=3120356 RepID=UPI002FCDFE2A
MTQFELQRIIYSSSASSDITPEDIQAILRVSQRKNSQVGITGVLLFVEGTFIQVIEGSQFSLDQFMWDIRQDQRHDNIETLCTETIQTRMFPNWSMAYIGDLKPFSSIKGLKSAETVILRLQTEKTFVGEFITGCVKALEQTS